MDNNQKKELLRFLLKQLRGTTQELFAHQAVFMNLSPAVRASHEELLEHYRHEIPIQQKVEKEFLPFDELIEQSPQDFLDQKLAELLKNYKPVGKPN